MRSIATPSDYSKRRYSHLSSPVWLTIVRIHAQISHVAEGLLERALHVLVEDATDEALRSFRQVKHFGMGGPHVTRKLCI